MGEPDIDEELFRRLERFNIEYDIWIDQEEYARVAEHVVLCGDGGLALKDPENLDELEGTLRRVCMAKVKGHGDFSLAGGELEKGWGTLLVAKRLRGHLQLMPKSPSGCLDRLAEFVVGRLCQPPRTNAPGSTGISYSGEASKTLSLLHLNEVCACYMQELSVGFADQALHRINGWAAAVGEPHGGGQNVYELVALLNRGIGYAHRHQHRKAMRDFDQVMLAFDKWGDTVYANYVGSAGDSYVCGKISSNGKDELANLWKCYVYAPAVVHEAEVLSDLNRSAEQLVLLERLVSLPGGYGDYWLKRGMLLSALAEKDGNVWKLRGSSAIRPPAVIKDIQSWPGEELSKKTGIRQKRSLVLIEYQIEEVRQRWTGAKRRVALIQSDLTRLFEDLTKFERAPESSDGTESKDVTRLWIDYYDLLAGLGVFGDSYLSGVDVDKMCQVTGRFVDAAWFPDREQSRERLLKSLERARNALTKSRPIRSRRRDDHDKLKSAEIRVLRLMLHDKDLPRWQQAKVVRALQHLGEAVGEPSGDELRGPDDNECQSVVDQAATIFCDSRCPYTARRGDEGCESANGCRANTYQHILRTNGDSFKRQLVNASIRPVKEDAYWLTVLRRWQSFTPALSNGANSDSRGGGYFIYKTDKHGKIEEGVVVDPGFDFVENFLRVGFSIRDIDAVAMTHAHVDHTADFRALITLVVERDRASSESPRAKLLAMMTPGSFRQFNRAIAASRTYFRDVVVMEPNRGQDGVSAGQGQLSAFKVDSRRALHDDLTGCDSMGLVVSGKNDRGDWRPLVGFTGDTMWWPGMGMEYRDVPTLCTNMGGIVPHKKTTIAKGLFSGDGVRAIVREENHLYWPGFSLLTDRLKDSTSLIILSELGEELKGGIRTDLARGLRKSGGPASILPEDIGLTVKLGDEPEVYCMVCGQTVDVRDMRFESLGREESTYYLCKACKRYRRDAVKQAISECHENGWPLEIDCNS